jgi:hypothetical protein
VVFLLETLSGGVMVWAGIPFLEDAASLFPSASKSKKMSDDAVSSLYDPKLLLVLVLNVCAERSL